MQKARKKIFFSFGTVNTLTLPDFQNTDCLEIVVMEMRHLNDTLSVLNIHSDISQINKAAGKNFVRVQENTFKIIRSSIDYSKLFLGTFDISIRPLTKLWNFNRENKNIPTQNLINKAIPLVNYKDIILDEKKLSVMLGKCGQEIELGGIAKGFAADETKRILEENGIKDALINYGGTVIGLKSPYEIGIQHPKKSRGIPMGKLTINNKVVVTSGIYEKFFIKNNHIYHHIIDPRSGYPSNSDLCSVTLIGDSGMLLDALATAIIILGMASGKELIYTINREYHYNIEAIFITIDQSVFTTVGIKDTFTLLNEVR